jgi:hypothetical protein
VCFRNRKLNQKISSKKRKEKFKMKTNSSKCIWIACIAAATVCMTLSTANVQGSNLGDATISAVTAVNGECVQSTIDGNTQKWDVQAGGTYDVTLSGVTDCASQGSDDSIGVIVQNSVGGNVCLTAYQTPLGNTGVYVFRITLSSQCETSPILYCTSNCSTSTGMAARDALGGDHSPGHLRIATFDGSCAVTGNPSCASGSPTPTPPPTASVTACKFYDKNANGVQDTNEPSLTGWPFCISPLDNASPALQTQSTANGGCVTWSNLTVPGDYLVTEANANESNWFHSPDPLPPPLIVNGTSKFVFPASGGSQTVSFGNYCTQPSGGLTLGFWSNKNGQKILTGSTTGTTLLPAVVTLLNAPPTQPSNCTGAVLRNANGSVHTFTNSYADFKNWLLKATATNMAYMLSAQLATLKLDVNFNFVDGNAYDLCSSSTVNSLISTALDQLCMDGNTVSGNPTRVGQEHLKNCIDAINNNGALIPSDPSACPYTFPNPPTPCP